MKEKKLLIIDDKAGYWYVVTNLRKVREQIKRVEGMIAVEVQRGRNTEDLECLKQTKILLTKQESDLSTRAAQFN